MKKYRLALLLLLLGITPLVAQNGDSKQQGQAQVTFAYPLGTRGIDAMNYSNNFSLNILYGLNGGVDGFELGSIVNYNQGAVKGGQLSGVANITKEESSGLVLSGVGNVNLEGGTRGALISGVFNYAKEEVSGTQVSTVNMAMDDFQGFQLGVVNYINTLNGGVQLGVVNYIHDREKGVPLGLVSVVRGGLFELEVAAGEVLWSNLNYKMGIEQIYTIYKIGYTNLKMKGS